MTTLSAALPALLPGGIPSPSQHTWLLGPVPLRAYALAILLGIAAAIWITMKRWAARGGNPDDVLEIAFWAVPFGIIGGRVYHVISSPDDYWGPDGDPVRALKIWEGGLGIWGAVALGAVGAWIACRRLGVRLPVFADALAPGLLVAQAIGRLGNWFNQELFGAPTTLPWGLEISPEIIEKLNEVSGSSFAAGTLFHPTFLYELLWNLAVAALLVWIDRRYRLGHGRVFWAYVVLYTLGRVWIEMLRIDTAEHVLGLRLNVWTSIVVGLGALVAFVVVGRLRPGREDSPALAPTPPDAVEPAASSDGPADDETRDDKTREDETREDERGKTKQSASAKAAGPDPGTAAGA